MSDLRTLGSGQHSTVQPSFTQTHLIHIRRFLTTSAFAASTATAYTAAVTRYLSWCRHHRRHKSVSQLDRCVEPYICYLYFQHHGRNRQLAVNTVYGLYMQHPALRDRLRGSEGLLRGWQRTAPSVSHPPLTWPLTIAIARTMAGNGYVDCAVATLVAFDGLLRVGELVAIMVADVSLPDDSRRGAASRTVSHLAASSSLPSLRHSSSAYIRLAVAKTGSNQTAEITNVDVITLLQHHISSRPADGRLFPFPSASPADCYRSILRATCVALGVGSFHFTPHSVRHGGATHAHMHMGQTIEHVLHRGRWQSNSSARIYLQTGAAALIATQLPEHAQQWVARLQSQWLTHLRDCLELSRSSPPL